MLLLLTNNTLTKDLYTTCIINIIMDKENRETTSIKINPELWKETKKYCIDKNITISQLIEQLLKKEIMKVEKK